MAMKSREKTSKQVETLTHDEAKRANIPTAEYQSVMEKAEQSPLRVAYERRNRDLDPQLVWRGKDEQDWMDLVVQAPPLFIQEKVHPKVLIDDLMARTKEMAGEQPGEQIDLFADFNGLPDEARSAEFYQHEANWTNRMILGDSLQVMASLAEREGLRGKVQCIYVDPPYGIKFNSNFQWSTTSRDVKDGKTGHITREPEQVKAFRDTWRDGTHSYLTYLRDRLAAAQDLLADTGSVFVQIGDDNVHFIRSLLDEVFGARNFAAQIGFLKTGAVSSPAAKTNVVGALFDYVVWYAKDLSRVKYRQPFRRKRLGGKSEYKRIQLALGGRMPVSARDSKKISEYLEEGARVYRQDNIISSGYSDALSRPVSAYGGEYRPNINSHWKTTVAGMYNLLKADRLEPRGKQLAYVRFFEDFPVTTVGNWWDDVILSSRAEDKVYVVQTSSKVVQRCILMSTDPGELVLDPTCGSGTTAYIAEQWGRRWITIDTSRVALALARARIMGARYSYYLLADSRGGQIKEAEITRSAPSGAPTHGNIKHGFVYERVPHITLKAIANNAEIEVIWEKFQGILEPLREQLNAALGKTWEEWEIPRDPEDGWPVVVRDLHRQWWAARITRQKEIDSSIAAKTDPEYLYDKPYEDKSKVRVAGPFTVESLSPHRVLTVDEDDELLGDLSQASEVAEPAAPYELDDSADFARMILDHLKTSGVQQAHKEDRITFTAITGWPGHFVCAEGRYLEGKCPFGKRA